MIKMETKKIKPIHFAIVTRNYDDYDVDYACGIQGIGEIEYTIIESGVTCKNCLKSWYFKKI